MDKQEKIISNMLSRLERIIEDQSEHTEWLREVLDCLGQVLDERVTHLNETPEEPEWEMEKIAEARQNIRSVVNSVKNTQTIIKEEIETIKEYVKEQ